MNPNYFCLITLLIAIPNIYAQNMEIIGKMVVKDINTISTFQSTVKNSFIRLNTNDDPMRGTSVGYFDDNTDKYFYVDTPDGPFGELIIESGTSYVGFGLTPKTPFHFKCTAGDEYGMTIERGVNTDKWEISAYQGNLSFFYNGALSPTSWIETDGDYNPSDMRLKKDISQLNDAIDHIQQLNIINYRLKEENADSKISIGVIAQEIAELFPALVSQNKGRDGEIYYGVNYSKLGVIALKGIQEQQEIIDSQNESILSLQEENTQLKARLDNIETILIAMSNSEKQ